MRYLIIGFYLFSYSLSLAQPDQHEINKIAKEIDQSIDKKEFLDFNNKLFSNSDISELMGSLTVLYHDNFVENASYLFTPEEYEIFSRLSIKVEKDNIDPLSIVKVNQEKGELIFNENFISKLLNNCHLSLYTEYPELKREQLAELYPSILYNIDPLLSWDDILCISMEEYQMYNTEVTIKAMLILAINIMFIELHELYHLCYDNNKGIESELKADSFALDKIINLFESDSTGIASLSPTLDSLGNIHANDVDVTITTFLLFGLTFDFIDKVYRGKPHLFKNTLKANFDRKNAFLNQIYKQYCTNSNSEMCSYLEEILANNIWEEIPLEGLEYLTELDNGNFYTFSDRSPFSFLLKITMLLFDKDKLGANSLIDLVLEKELSNFPLESHEIFYFISGHLKAELLGYDEAVFSFKRAREFSKLLPKDYYDNWLKMNDMKPFEATSDTIKDLDKILTNRYNNFQIDSNYIDTNFHIPYTFNFGKSEYSIYGNMKYNSNQNANKDSSCIFYRSFSDGYIAYEGGIKNNYPEGSGILIYKIDTDSSTVFNYLITFFEERKATGITTLRFKNRNHTFLVNLEDEHVVSNLSYWDSIGNFNTLIPNSSFNMFISDEVDFHSLSDSLTSLYFPQFKKITNSYYQLTGKLIEENQQFTCITDNHFMNLFCRPDFSDKVIELLRYLLAENKNKSFRHFLETNIKKKDQNFIYENALKEIYNCLIERS